MEKLVIVTNSVIFNKLKTIPYFKLDLGQKFNYTRKELSKGVNLDPFLDFYQLSNNRFCLKSGVIGPIDIYIDHGLRMSTLRIYKNNNLFEFDYDKTFESTSKSMQAYLGKLLKSISDKKIDIVEEKEEVKKEGNKENIMLDPGNVSWDDLMKYKNKKNV